MKVSILSMQNIDNYGSVLQAYSLKKIIESLDNEVYFIKTIRGDNEELNKECIEKPKNNTVDNYTITTMERIVNKIGRYKTEKMYSEFRRCYLYNSKSECANYDVCVIGSDEVFNCIQDSKWGFDSQLFGNVKSANKIITYAACCGSTCETDLTENLRRAIIYSFQKISCFSVRDENTKSFVRSLTNKIPVMNFDPVAVGDFDSEIDAQTLSVRLPDRYCIIYAYQNRINNKKTINAILELCERENMTPVAIFGKQEWIPKKIVLSPFEVLKAFKNAEFVVTDTFHGTLFGIKYAKKMAVIVRKSNKNKLVDLVNKVKIQKHVVDNVDFLKDIFDLSLPRTEINSILLNERARTITYLENNL